MYPLIIYPLAPSVNETANGLITPGWCWCCGCEHPQYMDGIWSQPYYRQTETTRPHSPTRWCAAIWSPSPVWGRGIWGIKPGVPPVQHSLQPSHAESWYCNDNGTHGEVQAYHQWQVVAWWGNKEPCPSGQTYHQRFRLKPVSTISPQVDPRPGIFAW